jgi:hypothetical protein
MADELDKEYKLLSEAIQARDAQVWQQWTNEFDVWMSGDHSGRCPFETAEVSKRASRYQYYTIAF